MSMILIIDDSMFQRNILRDIVKEKGYQTMEAVNGQEAFKLLKEEKPDLILSDLIMPGKDGLKYIKQLTEKFRDIPVIVITADIQDTTREVCIEHGVKYILHKPVKPEELLKVISYILK